MNYYRRGMKAVISQKGQVTVPKACREKLGLTAGTELDFEAVDGRLIARKVPHTDPIQKWRGRGSLPGGSSVDEYLNRIRS
jgi:antitoxin PrlF